MSHAQLKEPPVPGSYFSAKDYEWKPPLPFNPHPELPVVEFEPGKFLVDDTGLPDTPEQVAGRAAHQAAVEHAKLLAANPALAEAERAARQATQEAAFRANREKVAPWLLKPLALPSGEPATTEMLAARRSANLQALSQALAVKAAQDKRDIEDFTQAQQTPRRVDLPGGGVMEMMKVRRGVPQYLITHNLNAARTVSTTNVWPGGDTGLALTGTNTLLGLWDGGDVLTNHQEFTNVTARVIDRDGATTVSGHSTHVAGTLAARGTVPVAHGMSAAASILAYDWTDDFQEMTDEVAANPLRVSNHSYGFARGWWYWEYQGQLYWAWYGDTGVSQTEDYLFGFYDENAQELDQIVYDANDYLPVWSAGNERGGINPGPAPGTAHIIFIDNVPYVSTTVRDPDGGATGYDTLPSHGVAKNILTIGSVGDLTNGYSGSANVALSTFSSIGPTDDGRTKPDLVGNGEEVYSTGPTNASNYLSDSGTSMAAPNVAGSINLLVELQSRLYGTNRPLWASTLKGLAIHTADEAGVTFGPDYRFGWGLLNTRRAALLIQSNYISQSKAHIKEVVLNNGDYIEFPVVSDGTQPLKVTICWTDPPATPAAASVDPTNRTLINDLDLRVISPSGSTNFPYVLNPAAPTNAATTGDNVRDNLEQVLITNTVAGSYLVRVTHKGTLLNDAGQTNQQASSVLISGNVPQSRPALVLAQPVSVSTNQIALQWPSVVGSRYQVQYADFLAEPTTWANLGAEISATKTNVAVTVWSTNAYRFFQVVENQ